MKRIAPNAHYAARSRASILSSKQVLIPRMTLAAFMRGAGVAAMASLAFVGGISIVRYTLPAPQVAVESVSQQALAAEAQVVESQLALADVQHQVITEATGREISAAAASVAKTAAGASADQSVDRALDALSK